MPETLKKRSEVPVNETWDLTLIYENEDLMNKDLDEVLAITEDLEKNYKGKLNNGKIIDEALRKYERFYELLVLIENYVSLSVSVDYTDSKLLQMSSKIDSQVSDIFSRLSFIESEILAQPANVIEEAMELSDGMKNFLKDLLNWKPHVLHPEVERTLAAIKPITGAPYNFYETSKMSDMQFDDFEVNGKSYPLGYSLFEDEYEYMPETEVRRAAFRAFSNKIAQYQNSTAAYYQTSCQNEKIMSTLRGFDSVFDYLLFDQKVTREMYDRQIDLIMNELAPHMRKFAKLIKKVHKLDKMTYADLKLPVDPSFTPSVTIPDAHKFVKEGLAILGEDYGKMIDSAFKDRWIDFAQNIGKSTGGFCASPYGKNSFILLSYHQQMSDVFTLAHELGHAGHFKTCNNAQSIMDTNVSTYMVESPSTMNELLMANYLKTTSDDKRFRRWVLSSSISNTYYHNFVTHLLEAAYQREVYKIIDEGGSVQADTLNEIMHDTLKKFWGDDVELTEGAELTWMRQPHYYMGLYSYTYSAGLTVATEVARRIEKEGASAVEDWKKVLEAGSTLNPVELAALAKVDITTDEPLKNTIAHIGNIIDEIIALTEELEA